MTPRTRSVLGAALCATMPALAQFNMVPSPQCPAPVPATSTTEAAYRVEAARHVYDCFPGRIYNGVLPPLIFGVMTIEAQIDSKGQLVSIDVVRKPAADVIEPWVLAMLRRAAPFPVPAQLPGGTARFVETFFIDRSGLFQAHSLTESGSHAGPPGATTRGAPSASTTPP